MLLCRMFALRILFCVLFLLPLKAEDTPSLQSFHPRMFKNPDIRVDGHLDELPWTQISPIADWHQLVPNEGGPPSEKTVMRLFHDGEALYLGARLFTASPRTLLVRHLERDCHRPDEDAVALILDTLNDNRTAFGFIVSSAGIRTDIAIYDDAETGSTPWNTDWNAFWDAAAQHDDRGWSAEIRIPFSSLRVETKNGRAEMGLILWRYIAKSAEYDVFPAIPNKWNLSAYKPSQALDVAFEGIQAKNPLYVRPYVIGGLEHGKELSPDISAYNHPLSYQRNAGADLKFHLGSNHILDVTVNPDFAQVEADEQRINMTRFSLFFPEKRSFFQERSDLFDFRIPVGGQKLFHSRRIGMEEGHAVPIYGGLRLTGRSGRWQIGLLEMQTARSEIDGRRTTSENFGIFRVKRDVKGDGSYVGAMITSRTDLHGSGNTVMALDTDISLPDPNMFLKLGLAHGMRSGKSDGKEMMAYLTLESRIRRGFSYAFVARHIGRDFQPGIGYISRGGVNLLYNRMEYNWFPASGGALQNHGFQNKIIGYWNSGSGHFETLDNQLVWEGRFVSGALASIGLKYLEENLMEAFHLGNLEIGPGRHRFAYMDAKWSSSPGSPFQAGIGCTGGGYYGGHQWGGDVFVSWTLSSHLILRWENDMICTRLAGQRHFPHVVRFRIQSALNSFLSAGIFTQYNRDQNRWSSNFRLRYNPSEGVDLYLVYDDGVPYFPTDGSSQIFSGRRQAILLKLNYTFIL